MNFKISNGGDLSTDAYFRCKGKKKMEVLGLKD
jgi:hypothetical protein